MDVVAEESPSRDSGERPHLSRQVRCSIAAWCLASWRAQPAVGLLAGTLALGGVAPEAPPLIVSLGMIASWQGTHTGVFSPFQKAC